MRHEEPIPITGDPQSIPQEAQIGARLDTQPSFGSLTLMSQMKLMSIAMEYAAGGVTANSDG
jgi:hypothetical protein